VPVFDITTGPGPSITELQSYDGVIVGAPIHYGNYPQDILDWTWDHFTELTRVRTGLFTLSLSAADRRKKAREADDHMIRKFIQLADFHPHFVASFGDNLPYTQHGFVKRSLLKAFAIRGGCPTDTSRDHDLTDWEAVRQFVSAFCSDDQTSPFATVNRLRWLPESIWPIGLQKVA
jgi:menaquinone-dependent protoporphyrinogen oxidase